MITGGSSGIGRSIALEAASYGASLLLVARRQAPLDETLAALEAKRISPSQVFASWIADISKREEAEAAAQDILKKHKVDILINNAGVAYAQHIEETPPEIFEEMIHVNYLGTVWMTRPFLPHFKAQKAGQIVIVSSLAGVIGIFGYAAYTPSKFALMGFAEVLQNELSPYDIGVSVVLPPDTDTPQYAAENRTKPGETKAIAGKASLMTPEAVAHLSLQGIAKRRFHILAGKSDMAFTYYSSRYIPSVVRFFINRDVRNFRKK